MLLLAYSFVCFSVGLTCLGLLVTWERRERDPLARIFLLFYAALSVAVLGSVLRGLLEVLPEPVSPKLDAFVVYVEALLGRYGVLLTVPLLVHRLFGVMDRRRELLLITLVLTAAGLQHVTEYMLNDVWDERGDRIEDVFAALVLGYSAWVAVTRFRRAKRYRVLAHRIFWLFVIAFPATAYDLFWVDDDLLRFYPLLYCAFSIVATWTVTQVRPTAPPSKVLERWGLSERESEVAELVLKGQSNREIASELNISQNTVKTHLRSVFDKSGVRSRFELISQSHIDE